MMRSITATLSLAFEACLHEQVLEPAAGESLAPDRQNVAETTAAGVTVKLTREPCDGQTFGRIAIPFQTPLGIAR